MGRQKDYDQLCLTRLRHLEDAEDYYYGEIGESQYCKGSKRSRAKGKKKSSTKPLSVNELAQQCQDINIFTSVDNDDNTNIVMMPRGLKNPGNVCFVNATLQALIACPPFVRLVREFSNTPMDEYPTLKAFTIFISNLDTPYHRRIERREPFNANMYFKDILQKFTPDVPASPSGGRPSQEDAQEFLGFIMNEMHEELLKLRGCSSTQDTWETVQQNNKSSETRTKKFVPSELSEIFWGQEKSSIVVSSKNGDRASAAVEPFQILHLNIQPGSVHTLEDALDLFSASETLEGYRTSSDQKDEGEVVTASKSVKIQELPQIMILHLMRFTYGSNGMTKLHKHVRFPLDLVLGPQLLVHPSSEGGRRYELIATITHHGRETSNGHYTANTKSDGGQWFRCDDTSITAINRNGVLQDEPNVLFYKQI